MKRKSRIAWVALVCAVTATATSAGAVEAPATGAAVRETEPHSRIVWDASLDGTRVMSAAPDGSGRTVLYQQRRGASDNLVVSPDGRQVAFSPTAARGRPARLIVASTSAPRYRNVLPHRNTIISIGPVGWSRDGRRLVFQGFVDRRSVGHFYPSYLFSVTVRGAQLRRGRQLTDGRDNGAVYGSILVTRRGVVVPTDDRIVHFPTLGAGTRPRPIARAAHDVRPSGDGKWIFFRHVPRVGRQSLRRVSAGGGRPTVVKTFRADLGDLYLPFAPDHTGERLLVSRRTGNGPPRTGILDLATLDVTDLTFAHNAMTFAW